jgi:LysR family transcriptional regulator, carnitine catabolism transcriptional activator
MDLRQLRYALAVVDEGTFTAAAAACFVAQPSLSQAVAALERELGASLFDRLGRRVALTAAGEAFVPAAREALRAADTIRADVAAVTGLVAGHLDLVALPTLAVDPVTPLVGAFRRTHPGVVVRLAHPDDSDELLDRVRTGSSELGITELPVTAGRVVSRLLLRHELVAVLPPGTKAPRRLGAAALAARPLVTMPAGTSTRDALDAALAGTGARIEAAVETDQREAIGPLVLAGAGATVLPRPMAELVGAQGGVVVPLDPPIWRDIGIVHRDAPLSPAARAFLELSFSSGRIGPESKDRSG